MDRIGSKVDVKDSYVVVKENKKNEVASYHLKEVEHGFLLFDCLYG